MRFAASKRSFILLCAISVCLVIVITKFSSNYTGVCAEELRFWKWHRVSAAELLAFLKETGTFNGSIRTEYVIADVKSVAGDAYQRASFVDKIRGKAALLVSYHHPWLDSGGYLRPGGYFYSPNCLQNWAPPE